MEIKWLNRRNALIGFGLTTVLCAALLYFVPNFLYISPALFWYIPIHSLISCLLLLSVSAIAKIISIGVITNTLATVSLSISLCWLPMSIVFSGNVRNIFSSSSLVSQDVWIIISIMPLVFSTTCFFITLFQKAKLLKTR